MIAVEPDEAALHQRVTKAIRCGGELVRDGGVHGGIIPFVVALLENLQIEDLHHILAYGISI